MGWQEAFNTLVGVGLVVLGWLLKNMTDAIKDLRIKDDTLADKVSSLDTKMAGEFVHKDDLQRLSDAIFKKLDRIEEKLDRKVDR